MGNNQCCSSEVETKRELFEQVPEGIKAQLSKSNSEHYSINICQNEQVEVFRSGINLIRRPISNIKQLIEDTLQSYNMQLPHLYLQPAQFHQEVRVALEMILSSEEMTENLLQRVDETQQFFKTHGNYCYVSNKYLHRGEQCEIEPQQQQSPSKVQHLLSQHQFVFETPSKDKFITQDNSKPGLNSTPFMKFPKTQGPSNGEQPLLQTEKQTSKRLELSVSRQDNSQMDNSLTNSPYFQKQLDTEQIQKSNREDQNLGGMGSAVVMEHSFAFFDQNNSAQK